MNVRKRKITPPLTTIKEYAEATLPLIKQCLKERARNKKSYNKSESPVWHLYSRIFYQFGVAGFLKESQPKASYKAAAEYRKIVPGGDIRKVRWWKEQGKFDPGRKKFYWEHVYSGTMFINATEELYRKKQLTPEELVRLVKKEYCVAWILRKENDDVRRGDRGKTLKDALKFYEKKGVHLLKG